ncbi:MULTISPECIES: acyl-CoA desaturase [unclassified Frankia]|uniref:acyl-CoA desaturase n=1 Tax=unclassified Frankia TaxID=2632575 RepID=UPI0027DE9C65|nr:MULTISPECIES: acyl-CoA desaturase [unclassified Frankia]
MTAAPVDVAAADGPAGPDVRPWWGQVALAGFIVGPFAAVVAGVWYAATGGQISMLDVVLAVVFYAVTGHGVTIGFHRLLTHRAFTATRPLRIALAVAGSMSLQGSVISWVADHRKHHAHSDRDGDPHSPWRYGTGVTAVAKGLCWSHLGWLFDRRKTHTRRYAPDLLADPDIARVDRLFPLLTLASLAAPAACGFLASGGSVHAAGTALL